MGENLKVFYFSYKQCIQKLLEHFFGKNAKLNDTAVANTKCFKFNSKAYLVAPLSFVHFLSSRLFALSDFISAYGEGFDIPRPFELVAYK